MPHMVVFYYISSSSLCENNNTTRAMCVLAVFSLSFDDNML